MNTLSSLLGKALTAPIHSLNIASVPDCCTFSLRLILSGWEGKCLGIYLCHVTQLRTATRRYGRALACREWSLLKTLRQCAIEPCIHDQELAFSKCRERQLLFRFRFQLTKWQALYFGDSRGGLPINYLFRLRGREKKGTAQRLLGKPGKG